MIRFSGEEVQAAWEDYKACLLGMGWKDEFKLRMVESHFKQGFALGVAFEKGQQVKPTTVKRVRKHKRPKGTGHKRYRSYDVETVINDRTEEERNKQESHVLSFLKQCVRAMELCDIIDHMNKMGFNDWHNKTASSYMVTLMKGFPGKVSKVSRGRYQYTGGQVL